MDADSEDEFVLSGQFWVDEDGVKHSCRFDSTDTKEPDEWNEYPESDDELLRVSRVRNDEDKSEDEEEDDEYYYDSEDEGARRLQEYNAWLKNSCSEAKKKRKRDDCYSGYADLEFPDEE